MFGSLGAPELIVIGLIVVLLFGVGKIGRLGKDLGVGVKEFRRAMSEEDGQPGVAPGATVEQAPAGLLMAPQAVQSSAEQVAYTQAPVQTPIPVPPTTSQAPSPSGLIF